MTSDTLVPDWFPERAKKAVERANERSPYPIQHPDGRVEWACCSEAKPCRHRTPPPSTVDAALDRVDTHPAATAASQHRTTDPGTSRRAAASVGDLREKQARILALLADLGPMTDEEIAHAYAERVLSESWPSQSSSGLRTRRAELVDAGHVEDTGKTRRTASGRASIVWGVS